MEKPTVYLETSVISYLTATPSSDPVVAARQQLTKFWWEQRSSQFDCYASQLVIDEAQVGDPEAASKRIRLLKSLSILEVGEDERAFANEIVVAVGFPENARADALHLATAIRSGMRYMVSWNLRHIINLVFRRRVELFTMSRGLDPPFICTPDDLEG